MATINKRDMNYRIDFPRMPLIMTAEFADNAYLPDTEEYEILTRLKKDFPDLKIERKTHRTPSKYTNKQGEEFTRNQFKDLTYKRMEMFISKIPNSKMYAEQYQEVKDFATAINGNGYSMVRKWFVAQFPNFRKDPMIYLNNKPVLVLAKTIMDEAIQAQREEKRVVGFND